jgi:hypothetical protein
VPFLPSPVMDEASLFEFFWGRIWLCLERLLASALLDVRSQLR